jgi:molybdopterin converting factor small subunit
VFSKAAEVRTMGRPVTGKDEVNIERIEPQGQYGVRILFDDGHDTGIYSWDTLYALGRNRESNWASYLQELERIGYLRPESEPREKQVKLLYFSWLAKKLRRESEELPVPPNVADVDAPLAWLGRRKRGAAPLFERERVRVTLNKQLAEGFSKIHDGDEVGIVPTSPTAPATPDLV